MAIQYSCLENPHGQRSLVDDSSWGCKESDMTDFHFKNLWFCNDHEEIIFSNLKRMCRTFNFLFKIILS